MIARHNDHPRELRRWALSAAVVVMLHGGIAAAMAFLHDDGENADPTSALVIDRTPMPLSPAMTPMEIPPGPEQVQAESVPERPHEMVEETPEEKIDRKDVAELKPDIAPAENPEVLLAEAAMPQPELPTPEVNQDPVPITTAPSVMQAEEAPVASAPMQAPANVKDSNSIPTWKRQVVTLLERNKRYPEAARSRNHSGTAQLEFSLDRQGRVTASRITKSSGSAVLDQETLDLVHRAQPFPPPPPALGTAQVNLTVPIRFNIH